MNVNDATECRNALNDVGIDDINELFCYLQTNVYNVLLAWRSSSPPHNQSTTMCVPHGSPLNAWLDLYASMRSVHANVPLLVSVLPGIDALHTWCDELQDFTQPMNVHTLAKQYMYSDVTAMREAFVDYTTTLPAHVFGVNTMLYKRLVKRMCREVFDEPEVVHSDLLNRTLEVAHLQHKLYVQSLQPAPVTRFDF